MEEETRCRTELQTVQQQKKKYLEEIILRKVVVDGNHWGEFNKQAMLFQIRGEVEKEREERQQQEDPERNFVFMVPEEASFADMLAMDGY